MHVAPPLALELPSDLLAPYQYLLLGELRLLLEEADGGDDARRWLLAVLDRLLATYPRQETPHLRSAARPFRQSAAEEKRWTSQLERLRDRVAHRAPYQILSNEIRCQLPAVMDQFRSKRDDL
jgi:hypothetical protein